MQRFADEAKRCTRSKRLLTYLLGSLRVGGQCCPPQELELNKRSDCDFGLEVHLFGKVYESRQVEGKANVFVKAEEEAELQAGVSWAFEAVNVSEVLELWTEVNGCGCISPPTHDTEVEAVGLLHEDVAQKAAEHVGKFDDLDTGVCADLEVFGQVEGEVCARKERDGRNTEADSIEQSPAAGLTVGGRWAFFGHTFDDGQSSAYEGAELKDGAPVLAVFEIALAHGHGLEGVRNRSHRGDGLILSVECFDVVFDARGVGIARGNGSREDVRGLYGGRHVQALVRFFVVGEVKKFHAIDIGVGGDLCFDSEGGAELGGGDSCVGNAWFCGAGYDAAGGTYGVFCALKNGFKFRAFVVCGDIDIGVNATGAHKGGKGFFFSDGKGAVLEVTVADDTLC